MKDVIMFENVKIPINSPVCVLRYTLYEDNKEIIEPLTSNFEKFFGVESELAFNDAKNIWVNFSKDDQVRIIKSIADSRDNLSHWNQKYYYNTPKSNRKWLEAFGYPDKNEDGSISWYTLVIDNTHTKKISESHDKLNIRYATLLNAVFDAIIVTNDKMEVVSYNKAAQTMFGYSPFEIIGKSLNKLIPQKHHEKHKTHVSNFKKSPISSRIMWEFRVVEGVNKKGEVFPVDISIGKSTYEKETLFIAVVKLKSRSIEENHSRNMSNLNSHLDNSTMLANKIIANQETMNKDEIANYALNIVDELSKAKTVFNK